MRMTRACEYGLQGVLYLAMQPEGKASLLSEISAARGIPCSFLGKIFRHLVRVGIVKSIRGIRGGFMLARKPDSITMRDVVEAVEKDIAFSDCSGNGSRCTRRGYCSMSSYWQAAQEKALSVLSTVTFRELVHDEYVKKGKKNG